MKRVVERCPNCGVEHDHATGGACEVCGTQLRFWCRVHGAQTGWLDEPVCPRCEAELAEPIPSTPTPRPSWRHERPRPPGGADRGRHAPPAEVGRRSLEGAGGGEADLRPYLASGAGVALRLVRALMAVVFAVLFWGVIGMVAGGVFAYSQGGDPVWTALFGAMVGGGVGLLLGAIRALRILLARPPTRH